VCHTHINRWTCCFCCIYRDLLLLILLTLTDMDLLVVGVLVLDEAGQSSEAELIYRPAGAAGAGTRIFVLLLLLL
jgi:hypothetical protein